MQPMQNMQGMQNFQSTRNTQNMQNNLPTQSMRNIQRMQHMRNIQPMQNMRSMQLLNHFLPKGHTSAMPDVNTLPLDNLSVGPSTYALDPLLRQSDSVSNQHHGLRNQVGAGLQPIAQQIDYGSNNTGTSAPFPTLEVIIESPDYWQLVRDIASRQDNLSRQQVHHVAVLSIHSKRPFGNFPKIQTASTPAQATSTTAQIASSEGQISSSPEHISSDDSLQFDVQATSSAATDHPKPPKRRRGAPKKDDYAGMDPVEAARLKRRRERDRERHFVEYKNKKIKAARAEGTISVSASASASVAAKPKGIKKPSPSKSTKSKPVAQPSHQETAQPVAGLSDHDALVQQALSTFLAGTESTQVVPDTFDASEIVDTSMPASSLQDVGLETYADLGDATVPRLGPGTDNVPGNESLLGPTMASTLGPALSATMGSTVGTTNTFPTTEGYTGSSVNHTGVEDLGFDPMQKVTDEEWKELEALQKSLDAAGMNWDYSSSGDDLS